MCVWVLFALEMKHTVNSSLSFFRLFVRSHSTEGLSIFYSGVRCAFSHLVVAVAVEHFNENVNRSGRHHSLPK